MKKELKAYMTFYNKDKTITKVVWTIEEAKKNLTEKQFEKLDSFLGIHTKKMSGYIGYNA